MNAYQVYRSTQAQTAAPGELMLMLLQGAVRFISQAERAIEASNVEDAHSSLVRAQAIVVELLTTLDFERGGTIAADLAQIYTYMHGRLVEANVRKDAAPLREVGALLRELLPAWEQAVRATVPRASVAA